MLMALETANKPRVRNYSVSQIFSYNYIKTACLHTIVISIAMGDSLLIRYTRGQSVLAV
jgi:hypothetical protein